MSLFLIIKCYLFLTKKCYVSTFGDIGTPRLLSCLETSAPLLSCIRSWGNEWEFGASPLPAVSFFLCVAVSPSLRACSCPRIGAPGSWLAQFCLPVRSVRTALIHVDGLCLQQVNASEQPPGDAFLSPCKCSVMVPCITLIFQT